MALPLPRPTIPKNRKMIAAEYDISVLTFSRKLKKARITLPSGTILVRDQLKIYKAFGAPPFIWSRSAGLVPFSLDVDH